MDAPTTYGDIMSKQRLILTVSVEKDGDDVLISAIHDEDVAGFSHIEFTEPWVVETDGLLVNLLVDVQGENDVQGNDKPESYR